ncbi:MAG TPA: hypothetical protein VF170_03210, partial [Planctomycetaceae bacterium]
MATWLITVGGIGTIVAVSGVCVYLLWTVLPLFKPASLGDPQAVAADPLAAAPEILRVADSNGIAWAVDPSGELTVFRPDTGEVLRREPLASDGPKPTAFAAALAEDAVAIGFEDGTVKLGTVRFETTFLDPAAEGATPHAKLRPGEFATDADGVVLRTPQDQLRREAVAAEFSGEPVEVSPGSAVRRLDRVDTDAGPVLLAWSDDGQARVVTIGRTEDLFTGEVKLEAGTTATLPVTNVPKGPPLFVGLAARAAGANLVWPDGTALRFDVRDKTAPRLTERADIAAGDRRLTQVDFMIGRLTLLAGDSAGGLAAWFPARPEVPEAAAAPAVATDRSVTDTPAEEQAEEVGPAAAEAETAAEPTAEQAEAAASGRSRLVKGHDFGDGPAAVAAIAPSSRSREAAVGYADGTVRVVQVTTEVDLAEARLPVEGRLDGPMTLFLPPSEGETTLYAAAGGRLYRAPLDLGYPEAGLRAYFRPVWYESYPGPRHVWQTSSGTNAAEMKVGLVPLVFGTLKATFYSLLFGVPLALLAALYTSEFLSKSARARVKPVIEVMASLPSVVLGFLAAIVFAPVVEDWLPAVIAAGLTVPLSLLAAAHLWQLGPWSGRPRWDRWRLPLAAVAIALGFVLAALLGPVFETWFFAGDVKRW